MLRDLSSPRAIPQSVNVTHRDMGEFQFFVQEADEWLFTDNETNVRRLYDSKDGRIF